jgi:hypothetical protein
MSLRGLSSALLVSLLALGSVVDPLAATEVQFRGWGDFGFLDENFEFFKDRPFIAGDFGVGQLDRDGLDSKFGDLGSYRGRLGFVDISPHYQTRGVLRLEAKYVALSHSSTDIAREKPAEDEVESELWRFDLGDIEAFGYKAGEASIIPYFASTMSWHNFDVLEGDQPFDPPADSSHIDRYVDHIRYGQSVEAGIRFAPVRMFALEASFERSQVYPSFKFWKLLMSDLIELVAHGLAEEFVKKIGETSPRAVPIVNFLLRSGISYGLYELRSEKMNWPFETIPPLTYDSFRVGISVTF